VSSRKQFPACIEIILCLQPLCFLFIDLGQLSGVAAILRFPLPDLEDSESDDSDE